MICVSGESRNHSEWLDFSLRDVCRHLRRHLRVDLADRRNIKKQDVFIWLVNVDCLCERNAAAQYSAVVASFKHYGLHSAFRVWTKADACSMYCPHSVFVDCDLLRISNLKLLRAKRIEVFAVLDSKLAFFYQALRPRCICASLYFFVALRSERSRLLSFFTR